MLTIPTAFPDAFYATSRGLCMAILILRRSSKVFVQKTKSDIKGPMEALDGFQNAPGEQWV